MRGASKLAKCKVWVLNDDINVVVINNRFCSKFRRIAVGQFFLLVGVVPTDSYPEIDHSGWSQDSCCCCCFVLSVHTLHYFEVLLSPGLCH